MSTHERDVAAGAETGGMGRSVASGAALFATFYVHRERAPSFYEELHTLTRAADSDILIRDANPPAAHDATAIRLIFNAPGDVAAAWKAMGHQLEGILGSLSSDALWWGYTVIYQAVLAAGEDIDPAFAKLLPSASRIGSSETLKPLEKTSLAGGKVWLLATPQHGDGLSAATIYVAMSSADAEVAFKKVLLGPRYLMVDLIAHKGYFLKRQYRGTLQLDFKEHLQAFWKIIDDLLGNLGQRVRSSDALDKVARTYGVLVSIVSKLNQICVSMTQQLHNYEPWRREMQGNAVVEYHYGHLEIGKRDLELMVSRGNDALEVASTAMSMTQVELDKELENRQSLIQDLLAVVGAGLAVPELVNHQVAKGFLRFLGFHDFHGVSLLAFMVQLGAIVVGALLTLLIVRFVDHQRKRQQTPGERYQSLRANRRMGNSESSRESSRP